MKAKALRNIPSTAFGMIAEGSIIDEKIPDALVKDWVRAGLAEQLKTVPAKEKAVNAPRAEKAVK